MRGIPALALVLVWMSWAQLLPERPGEGSQLAEVKLSLEEVLFVEMKKQVETVLVGSLRRAGNRMCVTAPLLRIVDESNLFSDRFDRELTDVFAIQDEISQRIAGALKVKLAILGRRVEDLPANPRYRALLRQVNLA